MRTLRTNTEWIEWGRRDPFFGVVNWPGREATGPKPWTPEEFYVLGESDWADFKDHWLRYGLKTGTFVEIGCGAGRITKQLASAFESGHALDISADMIGIASGHVTAKNVTWHVTRGITIPLPDNSVDAAFSCLVLQHLPSEDAGLSYFREIARVLMPRGSLMLHLPIHNFPDNESRRVAQIFDALHRYIARPIFNARTAVARARMSNGGTPPMHGTSYDRDRLYRYLTQLGLHRVEFSTFPLTSNGALFTFVMAEKPDSMTREGRSSSS